MPTVARIRSQTKTDGDVGHVPWEVRCVGIPNANQPTFATTINVRILMVTLGNVCHMAGILAHHGWLAGSLIHALPTLMGSFVVFEGRE
jgi:hypothetical protein